MVGPVKDEDGRVLGGANVRVVQDIDVVEGSTDAEGKVEFEVDHTWSGETVQCFISKEGYDTIRFPAEISDYEFFVPLGGYVPPMVRSDAGTSIEGATTMAIAAVVLMVLVMVVLLVRGRGDRAVSITEEEADEILSEGPRDTVEEGPPDDPGGPPA